MLQGVLEIVPAEGKFLGTLHLLLEGDDFCLPSFRRVEAGDDDVVCVVDNFQFS